MELTAIFESWHIEDGNYPPLRKGQQVNLSFEMKLSSFTQADTEVAERFVERGGGEYEFVGTVLRVYREQLETTLTIMECVGFRFYSEQSLPFSVGERVQGIGTLYFDNYIWVEFLDRYPEPPNLFYSLQVTKIRRVQIPEQFIYRNHNSSSSPTSLGPSEYELKYVTEIENMEDQASGEEFYLLDLTDQGVTAPVARTFLD